MNRAATLLAVLLGAGLVAGCAEPGTPEGLGGLQAAPNGPTAAPEVPAFGANVTPVRFAGQGVQTTLWFNGTYNLQDAYHPVGMVTSNAGVWPASQHLYDISDQFPTGFPVLVTLDIHAPLAQGDVDIWLNVPPAEVWSGTFDTPRGGDSRIQLVVVHASGEPVQVGVWYDEVETAPSFSYALRVDIEGDPGILRDGVPVTVPLANEGDVLRIQPLDDATDGQVLLWDPRDTFVGRFDVAREGLAWAVPVGAPTGEHVMMVAGGGPSVRLGVEPGPSAEPDEVLLARATTQTIEAADPRPLARGSDEWAIDIDPAPLQVALFIDGDHAVADLSGELRSPSASLFDFAVPGPTAMSGFFWITSMGDERLEAGPYTVTLSNAAATGGATYLSYVTYART